MLDVGLWTLDHALFCFPPRPLRLSAFVSSK